MTNFAYPNEGLINGSLQPETASEAAEQEILPRDKEGSAEEPVVVPDEYFFGSELVHYTTVHCVWEHRLQVKHRMILMQVDCTCKKLAMWVAEGKIQLMAAKGFNYELL
ncbi:hypothetical protein CIPAW_07G216500 [Carya illinoinensis]|uniref:Uncharacterized protein n=1 Tax=Carya illinoinensis TaxID=32201 RepID=A0A8T1PY73_CARIL|nr:hypothetical protein CIPAW_07G216500 [Carya illinoinensis]KAG6649499.1 hypothetical protein CIPAW_07G216500 [Carya illinoinensis]